MRYICQICGYIYDDEKEKVPFESLPIDWKCPLCGAAKSDFKLESDTVEQENLSKENERLEKLTPMELSAIFSNLSRGCEKQYKGKEADLFLKLSEYFDKKLPYDNNGSVEKILSLLKEDIEDYPRLRNTADSNGDRGAARVCVWGEKVTRILNSLLSRYEEEGENMLLGKEIWVCTVCGFIYIGDKAPELCPVCKVPSWKFEKIEGRK